jgi:hypothetical protein
VWRGLFVLAAFFNFAVATAMLAAPDRIAMHLRVHGPGAPFVIATVGILIGAFGIGYALAARAPTHHRSVIWMGMVGKLGVAGLAAMQFAAGIIPFRYFALGMGDVAFAALFALFLWRSRRLT